MNNLPEDPFQNVPLEQKISALFRNMVAQQANTALMLLGKIPHPETGELIQDLEAAQFFVDQLEMLAHKTKGNLDRQEEDLLNRSLTLVRLAYVETVGKEPKSSSGIASAAPPPLEEAPAQAPSPSSAVPSPERPPPPAAEETSDDEPRKRFTKKY